MTIMEESMTGASAATSLTWNTINWQQAKEQVHRLQVRIAKATREGGSVAS
ncbi:reverse transcriptase N-terminal domain-containing protein [Candidatus Odyssella acanthamoebae]|uniref:reverse transcriptase N-terminal domain-containing protein n=1 Tax=Candidatus Odyssella acanthamoebae TaxID=91604 RepID=UPI0009FE3414|nr:reverse transcriptase N-terminal domain-containing protein [Candidatus Paracaedibacter acanthamoebae]